MVNESDSRIGSVVQICGSLLPFAKTVCRSVALADALSHIDLHEVVFLAVRVLLRVLALCEEAVFVHVEERQNA